MITFTDTFRVNNMNTTQADLGQLRDP